MGLGIRWGDYRNTVGVLDSPPLPKWQWWLKIMFIKNMKAARHSEAMLLRYYRNQQQFLFNDLYKRTDMAGVESLVGQLVKPTLGCQLWLDASARRPPGYFLVLPQELQQATSRYNSESMPLGWHKVKILYSEYKSDAEMDKMRKMQKCVPPHLLLRNGNGIQEQGESVCPLDESVAPNRCRKKPLTPVPTTLCSRQIH